MLAKKACWLLKMTYSVAEMRSAASYFNALISMAVFSLSLPSSGQA